MQEEPKLSSTERQLAELDAEQANFESILHDLDTNAAYQAYFDQFNAESIKEFKEKYARYKMKLLTEHWLYRDKEKEEKKDPVWNLAILCFWEIQQKKLFTLQCQWRAGKIHLPELYCSAQLRSYEFHIHTCKFISPVSVQELEEYLVYLSEPLADNAFWFVNYQDYDTIYKEYQAKLFEKTPAYYKYMYAKHGSEELEWKDLKAKAENTYKLANQPSQKEKPWLLPFDDDQMYAFLMHFGYKNVAEYLKIKYDWDWFQTKEFRFELIIEDLKAIGMDWPVERHENWQTGLRLALMRHQLQKIIRFLPQIYEQYKQDPHLLSGVRIRNEHMEYNHDVERELEDEILLMKQALRGEG